MNIYIYIKQKKPTKPRLSHYLIIKATAAFKISIHNLGHSKYNSPLFLW